MKKSHLMLIACLLCVIAFQAFTISSPPKYKNLLILPKDISESDMDSVMHHFTASLGVKCNYCHVRNEALKKMEFASDDKPEKLIARKMMQMAIDINTKYFKAIEDEMSKEKDHMTELNKIDGDSVSNMLRYVTCYTCHHGEAHPDGKPPKKEEGPKPPAIPKPAGQ